MRIWIWAWTFALLPLTSWTAYADHLRVSPAELVQILHSESKTKWTILDVRSPADYIAAHLPNALNFPVENTYQNQQINGQIVAPLQMQHFIQKLGLTDQSQVIIYDQGQLVDAARVFWALEVYGLTQVKILNLGFSGWQQAKLPISTEVPVPKPSDYIAQIKHQHLASKFTTQLATLNPNQIIIDARPLTAYLGEVSSAKRAGHIPSAINIPASHNMQQQAQSKQLYAIPELKKIYQAIPRDKKIITYCAIGRISAINYLALRELGYDVANYDASWKEWAEDFNLPIVTGNSAAKGR